MNVNESSPDCPPAPSDDDPLFDLDMSAVDDEADEMVSFSISLFLLAFANAQSNINLT